MRQQNNNEPTGPNSAPSNASTPDQIREIMGDKDWRSNWMVPHEFVHAVQRGDAMAIADQNMVLGTSGGTVQFKEGVFAMTRGRLGPGESQNVELYLFDAQDRKTVTDLAAAFRAGTEYAGKGISAYSFAVVDIETVMQFGERSPHQLIY